MEHPLTLPAQFQLGHTTITIGQGEFEASMDAGLECYFAADVTRRAMTEHELMQEIITSVEWRWDEASRTPIPDEWRLGFICGWLCGLLTPTMADAEHHHQTFIETLSDTHHALYPSNDSEVEA